MAKRQETQIQVLEEVRGEQGLTVAEFSTVLGISRQWYYTRLENSGDVLPLKELSQLAVDHVGAWVGDLAVRCIKLIDPRFVPCPCETEIGDNGPCPRHGGFAHTGTSDTPQSARARLLNHRVVGEVAA